MEQKGRILVVEPNDLILGLLQRLLGEAGYTVIVEAAQSLSRPDSVAGQPHLVIIDVPTPRTAEQLVRSVTEIYSSPILLLSARLRHGTGTSSDVAHELGVRKVLPKPFTCGELLGAVAASLVHEA